MDRAEVPGNGTLFDGSRVKTTNSSSLMYISGGPEVVLASNSEGAVYKNRLALEQGSGEIGKATNYSISIDAMGVRVSPGDSSAQARVTVKSQGVVEVASVRGPVNITGSNGAPIAHLSAGRVMNIGLQTGASKAESAGAPAATASYRGVLVLTLLSTAAAGGAVAAILETNSNKTNADSQ